VGQELAATARAIAQSWDGFEQQVDGIKGLSRGKLRVAVVSTAKYFMPRLIGSFCNRHPAIDVSLEILNRDGVVQRLRDNLDDLYIMSMPPADIELRDELHAQPHRGDCRQRRCAGTTPQGNAAGSGRAPLHPARTGFRHAHGSRPVFHAEKFHPNIRLELGSNKPSRSPSPVVWA
jgi:DNA-binding transcriptional LysR family regulator